MAGREESIIDSDFYYTTGKKLSLKFYLFLNLNTVNKQIYILILIQNKFIKKLFNVNV